MPTVSALAQPQAALSDFHRFKHRRWTTEDGAPSFIYEIAQTRDGYLWLASGDGLYRFDGLIFEHVPAPAGSPQEGAAPTAVMAARSGELWVGFRSFGGIAVYRNGRLHDMRMPDPPQAIGSIVEAADGAIWISSQLNSNRLARFAGGRWERMDEHLHLPSGTILNMQPTADGGLWVSLMKPDGIRGGLAYLAPGARRFRDVPLRLGFRPGLALDRGGGLWVADTVGTRMLFTRDGKPPERPVGFAAVSGLSSAASIFDREGGIWSTTTAVGLIYARSPLDAARLRPSRFGGPDGLSSDVTLSIFADREGNVWVGTERGLDHFRPAIALQEAAIPPDPIAGQLIAASQDGDVYVASGRDVFLIAPHRPPRLRWRRGAGNGAMCMARGGGVWVIDRSSTVRLRPHGLERFASPPDGQEPAACVQDRQGRLWLNLMNDRFIWHDGRGWHDDGPLKDATGWQIALPGSGDLAFTTPMDLGRLEGDRLSITHLAPWRIGAPSMIVAGAKDLFVGGNTGLLRVRGVEIKRLPSRRFPWIAGIREMVQTPQGLSWIIDRNGVSRLSTADLDRAFDDPEAPLPRRLFDSRDGLSSFTQHGGMIALQSAVGGDGRLWFLNREGAAYIDPARLRPNLLPPPVAIRHVTSGSRTYRDPTRLVFPPGTRSLDISYAALSLVVPERVRFRYRLDGVDEDWVDPGARRQASYANLGPGRYRFQVIAANNDGVWNNEGARLDFEIRPTFFESWPFRLLCAVAILCLLWLAYSMRLRVVASRIRARMTERMEERERIARDLHDTFLQSVQTLSLRFQLAMAGLSSAEAARPALQQAIDQADKVIAEGRDHLRILRPRADQHDLERSMADVVQRQFVEPGTQISITTRGSPRPLDPIVVDEATRIAGEAIFNVWRHAKASRLTIEIGFDSDLTLRIADDGVGIDPLIVAAGGKADHYGLTGMHERARALGGRLDIKSVPGNGTEVLLAVPGNIAYRRGAFRHFRRSRRSS